jgi:DNA primase
MGASTSEAAFKQLWQMTKRVVFCLDPDTAGQAGALRSVMVAAPTMQDGCEISIATLPAGKDPDEYVLENGADACSGAVRPGNPAGKIPDAAEDALFRPF